MNSVRRRAVAALLGGIIAIAAGYASAFRAAGAPLWGAWMLAVGIPTTLCSVMILGAARGERGVGNLKVPFALVFFILLIGFSAAIFLPPTEDSDSKLWLGLPARAAIIIYGIGLLPIVILPVAYAMTFETQTLDATDIERVKALARARDQRALAADTDPRSNPQ